jgi:ribonuclease Z
MSHNDQNVMRPFAPPSVDPAAIALDKFHPLVNGKQQLELSSNLQRSIKAAQENIAEVEASGELPPIEGSNVGIVALGTGGSLPTKYRNGTHAFSALRPITQLTSCSSVLSTLVRIPGWGNILLDAGEGTWGQLVRTFGLQDEGYNVWQALRDIKCIFISHVHADHHIGLAHILAKRSQVSSSFARGITKHT